MAKRNTQCNTPYVLEIIRGITTRLLFTYKDSDGTAIDLTGKTIEFQLEFDDIDYIYTDTPNSFGSAATVNSPETDGQFTVLITDEETASLDQDYTTGTWAAILVDGGNKYLLWKGTATVEDL